MIVATVPIHPNWGGRSPVIRTVATGSADGFRQRSGQRRLLLAILTAKTHEGWTFGCSKA
jgi:hypothetical protein